MTLLESLEQHITRFICTELHFDPEDIDPDINLGAFGVGSLAGTRLIGTLEEAFSLRLSPTLIFEYPSIAQLSHAIARIASQSTEEHRHV